MLVPLFPLTQHQENNKQCEICKNISQADALYLIVSVISLGGHAISQDPIRKVAAAACELRQCVHKSHFSGELYDLAHLVSWSMAGLDCVLYMFSKEKKKDFASKLKYQIENW